MSPTLGKDQLHAGIVAGLIGLALVALYMLVFYRLLGLVVIVGLVLTGMALYSLIIVPRCSRIGLTLTLAGVTGIIVSVGVTVDSYVVYFERLKDEVRTGQHGALARSTAAFARSFRTILAADLVSLIGAARALLARHRLGPRASRSSSASRRILDLLVAYFFMHPLVSLMARRPRSCGCRSRHRRRPRRAGRQTATDEPRRRPAGERRDRRTDARAASRRRAAAATRSPTSTTSARTSSSSTARGAGRSSRGR